jgi:hypothetical protein
MLQQDTEIIPIALAQSCLREWFGGGTACTDKMYFARPAFNLNATSPERVPTAYFG